MFRRSGDHGPFNSWDRVPYITNIGLHAPKASVFPQFRQIHHNFMLANYNSQEAIDNDDGSSFCASLPTRPVSLAVAMTATATA